MTSWAPRPLEDLLTELAAGLYVVTPSVGGKGGVPGVRPVSVELSFPVEMRVGVEAKKAMVLVDAPRTRTRTAFDFPLGRLSVRLESEAVP